jgi:hypothetical protein
MSSSQASVTTISGKEVGKVAPRRPVVSVLHALSVLVGRLTALVGHSTALIAPTERIAPIVIAENDPREGSALTEQIDPSAQSVPIALVAPVVTETSIVALRRIVPVVLALQVTDLGKKEALAESTPRRKKRVVSGPTIASVTETKRGVNVFVLSALATSRYSPSTRRSSL